MLTHGEPRGTLGGIHPGNSTDSATGYSGTDNEPNANVCKRLIECWQDAVALAGFLALTVFVMAILWAGLVVVTVVLS